VLNSTSMSSPLPKITKDSSTDRSKGVTSP